MVRVLQRQDLESFDLVVTVTAPNNAFEEWLSNLSREGIGLCVLHSHPCLEVAQSHRERQEGTYYSVVIKALQIVPSPRA